MIIIFAKLRPLKQDSGVQEIDINSVSTNEEVNNNVLWKLFF